MKQLLFILFLVFMCSCQNEKKTKGSENSLFASTFRDYKEIGILKGYEKVSDTNIFTGEYEEFYRLLRLNENTDHLIVFYKVVNRDSIIQNDFFYQVLDTLHIRDLKEEERISIGYCYNKAYYEGEIIGIVEETDSLQVQKIIKAWRANPEREIIEALEDFEEITCLNQDFEDKGKPVSLKHLDLRTRTH